MAEPRPAAGAPPLRLDRLTVRYGDRTAVDALSLEVRPGEIYGLLGANGAGKSSTIRSIVGLGRPTGGRVEVFGIDALADGLRAKAQFGYVPETSMLYESLTPREFLEFVAGVRRLDPTDAAARGARLLRAYEMADDIDRPIAALSNGTRQKVLLVAALLHAPPLLVLDEPFNHLDPRAVRLTRDLLGRTVADGRRGVLFSTHAMDAAERLCHRVGLLDRGRLRAEGSVAALRAGGARADATLEEIVLDLTQAEAGVRAALDTLEPG